MKNIVVVSLKVIFLTSKYALVIFACLAISLYLYTYVSSIVNTQHIEMTEEQRQHKVQELISEKDFSGLFENARYIGEQRHKGVYRINDAAAEYLSVHCATKGDIINLLKENGFSIHELPEEKLKEKEIGKLYDEVISGVKRGRSVSFLMYMSYRIEIYFNHGAVTSVQTKVSLNEL